MPKKDDNKLLDKGHKLHDDARNIVYRVIKFFEEEKQNQCFKFPINCVQDRAIAATGLSRGTIRRIKRQGEQAEKNNSKIVTSTRRKRQLKYGEDAIDFEQFRLNKTKSPSPAQSRSDNSSAEDSENEDDWKKSVKIIKLNDSQPFNNVIGETSGQSM